MAEAATADTLNDHKPLLSSSATKVKVQHHASPLLSRNEKQSFLQSEPPEASFKTTHSTAGVRSPDHAGSADQKEFKLSPIHSHSGVGIASKSFVSEESSSVLSSESSSTVSEAKGFSLTPIHVKQLTASDLFKSAPVDMAPKGKQQHDTAMTLSPLHATSSGVFNRSTSELKSPEKKALVADDKPLMMGLSPIDTNVTKLTVHQGGQMKVCTETGLSSPIHKSRTHEPSNLLLQHKADVRPQVSGDPTKLEDNLETISDQSQTANDSMDIQPQTKEEGSLAAAAVELTVADESGLGKDLAELQSALQAAGLPPMGMKEESSQDTLQPPSKGYPPVDISVEEPKISQSSAPRDAESAQLAASNSEPGAHMPESAKPASGGMTGLNLREAIRAIATEELTSISREILKQDMPQQKYQQPLPSSVYTPSVSPHSEQRHDDKRSEKSIGPSLSIGDHLRSHTSDEGMEEFSDLLVNIESTEGQESNVKHSKKPSLSNAKQSALPKASTKLISSKKGPVSKVDNRLSSKTASKRPSLANKASLKDRSRSRLPTTTKENRTPSTASVRGQSKLKAQSTSKSAPPKQVSSGRTSLKEVTSGTATRSSQPTRHQIVIPTGHSTAPESPSDSEDEIIHIANEMEMRKKDDGPKVKMDVWKKALQEEKVHSYLTLSVHVTTYGSSHN